MDDLTSAILSAWEVIGPRLKKNPLELARRLARRRLKTLRRPMRAWCLAVRASDARINPATALIVPEDAAYPGCPARYDAHRVTLTSELLRTICKPVTVEPPGVDWRLVAKWLGCDKQCLRTAIRKRKFHVLHVKGFEGRFGKPVPLIWTPYALDPSRHPGEAPDPVWASMWLHLSGRIPDGIEQAIERVPRIGAYDGHSVHRGWWWICPACREQVRIVFYPLPPINLTEYYGIDPARAEWDKIEAPMPTFACHACHGVRYFSRTDKNSWGELIHHLTGGLLYGYEVQKPSWLTPIRKRKFRPKLNRAPSQRRAEVLERLLLGWKDRQIAKDLGISYRRARKLAQYVLRQHRARNRKELIKLLRPSAKPGAKPTEPLTSVREADRSRIV